MSKVIALYHIVFCTKCREMTIPEEHCEDLYRFIWKDIQKMHCKLLRICGIPNHVHMLVELHSTVALSTFMQNVKSHSSGWMHTDARFRLFRSWAAEYYASTISASAKDSVIEYIKNQKSHHLGIEFEDEMSALCRRYDLPYDDRDMR